jgi:hypothetical protein
MSRVILKIRILQNTPYQFKYVRDLYKELYNCDNILNDDEIFNLSLILEPREKK